MTGCTPADVEGVPLPGILSEVTYVFAGGEGGYFVGGREGVVEWVGA